MSYPPPAGPPGPPSGGYGAPPPGGFHQPGYGYGGYGSGLVEHPEGTTVLVLGIISLAVCGLLGPVAWIMGNGALREIDADPGRYSNRSQVQTGRICGIITTIVWALIILAVLLLAVARSS